MKVRLLSSDSEVQRLAGAPAEPPSAGSAQEQDLFFKKVSLTRRKTQRPKDSKKCFSLPQQTSCLEITATLPRCSKTRRVTPQKVCVNAKMNMTCCGTLFKESFLVHSRASACMLLLAGMMQLLVICSHAPRLYDTFHQTFGGHVPAPAPGTMCSYQILPVPQASRCPGTICLYDSHARATRHGTFIHLQPRWFHVCAWSSLGPEPIALDRSTEGCERLHMVLIMVELVAWRCLQGYLISCS